MKYNFTRYMGRTLDGKKWDNPERRSAYNKEYWKKNGVAINSKRKIALALKKQV